MTNAQQIEIAAERLTIARRIRAAGIPIHIEEDDGGAREPRSGLLVYQIGGFCESTVFDQWGTMGVSLRVTITMNLSGFAIAEFGLELPWDSQISWLPDPSDSASSEYRFAPEQPLVLPRRDVLNHRADVRRMFRRGESLEGNLLGIGNEPIPENIKHGAEVPAFFIIRDQFGHPHRTSVSFWADRSARSAPRQARETPRRSIFDCPDPPNQARLACGYKG